jgi:hypothetical protein
MRRLMVTAVRSVGRFSVGNGGDQLGRRRLSRRRPESGFGRGKS